MFVSGNDRSVCYIHFHGARLFFFNSLLVIVPHPRIMIQQKHLTWQETMNVASLARSIYIYLFGLQPQIQMITRLCILSQIAGVPLSCDKYILGYFGDTQ